MEFGHTDCGCISLSIPVDNDGNFRSLLRYWANGGDQALQDHIENSSRNAMHTSPRIQNEIIDCFGQLIQKKIVKRVKKSCFYTVLADETTDISQVEQFSLCVRYIDDHEEPYTVREDFLLFVPVYDVTGEVIERRIAACGLDLAHIRGQGLLHERSIQRCSSTLKKKCPKAIYIHCVSHCLNLSLMDSFKVQSVCNAMSVISKTYTLFRVSAKRTKALEEKIKELEPSCSSSRIKTRCETR
ncbi:hypothetical protein PR048_019236 [Dryococelus australis]|uniref:DUF4371 domain-containing protein n=1 Tax=Dryococelus australis TaxID=614101 RepID=A0ABQ9H2X4_9NEOP|nr:hypothetical protein PR048_019236 [Dryococelus australis]